MGQNNRCRLTQYKRINVIKIIAFFLMIIFTYYICLYIESFLLCKTIEKGKTDEALEMIESMRDVNCYTGPQWMDPFISIMTQGDISNCPLEVACMYGNYEVVKALLEKGADVNKVREGRAMPIEVLVGRGHEDELKIMKMLVDYGADATKYNGDNSPLLKTAMHMGWCKTDKEKCDRYLKSVNYLMQYDKKWIEEDGFSLLHYASMADQIELMEIILIEQRELVKQKGGYYNDTALFYVSSVEAAQLLIKYGVDKTTKNNEGKTAYDYAVENENEELADILKFD